MKSIITKLLDKVPILKYIFASFVKSFFIFALLFGTAFGVLWFTGVYSSLERILDLKYDSPFVLVPMAAFAALVVLCFFVGFLLWFHKYKRPKTKSSFGRAVFKIPDNAKRLIAIVLSVLMFQETLLFGVVSDVFAAGREASSVAEAGFSVSGGEGEPSVPSVSGSEIIPVVPEPIFPVEGEHYVISAPNGENGWYKLGGALTITPTGSFDRIREGEEGKWMRELTKSDETPESGTEVTFYLANSTTGLISYPQTVSYRLDSTVPGGGKAEQQMVYVTEDGDAANIPGQTEWKREYLGDIYGNGKRNTDNYLYQMTLTAEDTLSGVSYFCWKYKGGDNWSEPIPADDGKTQIGVNYGQWYAGGGIDIMVCDRAGNLSREIAVPFSKFLTIGYDRTHLIRYIDSEGNDVSEAEMDGSTRLIYDQREKVKLTVKADAFKASEIVVRVNDALVPVIWTAEGSDHIGILEFSEGDSVIKIVADGYSILSSETGSRIVMGEYLSNTHTVDTIAPVLSVSFDTTADVSNAIFTNDRNMTVSVTEKNFRPDELAFSELSAKDIQGNSVNDFSAEEFLDALKNAEWETEGDVHRAEILFSADAFYDFTLEYSDLADNAADSFHGESFAIDKTAPNNLRITYSADLMGMLWRVVSFGYYNPSVTIRIYADDMTSGVDYFNWTYTREEGASTTMNVDTVLGQIDCTDYKHFSYEEDGRTAVAEFTLTADEVTQYRGSLAFTATDKAGHTSDIHYGDGTVRDEHGTQHDTSPDHVVVLDTIAPVCEVTYMEPQLVREDAAGITLYYDSTYGDIIPVTLKITEANFYAEDVIVKVNDAAYTVDDWSQDGDEWTGMIKLVENGVYVITITYTDRSNNKMLDFLSDKIVIDRVSPVIDKYVFDTNSADGSFDASDFVEVMEYGYFFKTEFTVKIYTSDPEPLSGIDRIEYRMVPYENGAMQDEIAGSLPVVDGMAEFKIPTGFKGQIFAKSYDILGNQSDEVAPQAIVIDKTVPIIELAVDHETDYQDAEGNSLYMDNMSITVTITDTLSGIREIGYAQSSEKASYDRIAVTLKNSGYQVGDDLGDGWIVMEMETNLVTKVMKQFLYENDDNHIILILDAMDSAGNIITDITSDKFTIDKTDPVIDIAFRVDDDTDLYYDVDRIADITVIERNFDVSLIKVMIENKFGDIPNINFTDVSDTEHTAVIVFDEGDYTFEVSGTDLGGHIATVNYSGGNEKFFYVDKTKPIVEDNFVEFTSETTKNSFNTDKMVTISIMEHNFDPDLVQLHIFKKDAGSIHNMDGMKDVTEEMVGYGSWNNERDIHTITFTVSADAVYQIEMSPMDLAGNAADHRSTVVFEIDQTIPIISARNGNYVSDDEVTFLDIYTYERKDDPMPTVEFSDINMDHIRYKLTVWIPDRSDSEASIVMQPKKIYLEEDPNRTGIIKGGSFTLPNFTEDGVYALELTAFDEVGNESILNINTYARMVEQDVLAYILESNVEDKTGLYSFQYENGTPISMRPDNFSNLNIFAVAREDSSVNIVLRDTNAEEVPVDAQVTADHSVYGIVIYHFVLQSSFFKETFSEDTDAELYLAIKNDGKRIDLGRIHIDNMAPNCDLPEDFRSWNWYFGEETRTITVSNISELLDEENCKVYDNGEEIPFSYSSDENTLSFTLEKGWHDVGIVVCDMAGNANNIQERANIYVGYMWLWLIIVGVIAFLAFAIYGIKTLSVE
ncbi:MAG: hypothetical protein NC126_03165 [Clostridium sp.]|nr:hypothetical protein [Clostridium sp.]